MRYNRLLNYSISCIFLVMLFWTGCRKQEGPQGAIINPEEWDKIITGVKDAMRSYGDAVLRLDAEGTVAHYAHESEFRVCFDNQISGYGTFTSQVRKNFASLSAIEGEGFTEITVLVLGPNVSAAVAPFRETFVDKSGNRTPVKGTVTWIWVRRGTEWKIIYGHATHEPDTES